jgi:hypothetical protein
MRAVWSWWTKPLVTGQGWTWPTPRHHLLSWVLSVETARQHLPRTALVTDALGAELLVERLGLEFDEVSTTLDELDGHDPEWWNLGKLLAYAVQEEPFVHVDQDVYLWKPLPERLLGADLFTQNPELFPHGQSDYRPETLEHTLHSVGGWVPEELVHCVPVDGVLRGACCGIIGGRRLDFIRYYAELALRLVDHPRNAPAWPLLGNKQLFTTVLEQYLLEACVRFQQSEGAPFRGVEMHYLFDSVDEAYARAAAAGFTHLIGGAKRDAGLLARIESRVRREYPAMYRRADRVASDVPVAA